MNISLDLPSAHYFVRSYRPGTLTLNDQEYSHSMIIMPESLIPDWAPQTFSELCIEHIQALTKYPIELAILGTGVQHHFPDRSVLAPLYQANIGVEIMSTEAACRTYNLLASEGRKVMAALLIR